MLRQRVITALILAPFVLLVILWLPHPVTMFVLGLLVAGSGQPGGASGGIAGSLFSGDWVAWLLLLNPADIFRILNIFSLDQLRSLGGVAGIVPPSLADPWLMSGAMLAWIAVPLVLAARRFR